MRVKLFSTLICLAIFCPGCGSPPPRRGEGEIGVAQGENGQPVQFRVEMVASNLEVPWAIAFTPEGRVFVTERPGRVRVIEQGRLRPEPVATIREVASYEESGLMDLTLHPQFESNHYLYLAYAYRGDGQRVRVVRFRETAGALAEPLVIIENIPAARYHAGTRTRFGPDGKLYITTGDATQRELAQRLDSLAGKTLRLNDDGGVPQDNPFVGRPNARPEIWSYGHRNAQGVAWQPGTDAQFQTERPRRKILRIQRVLRIPRRDAEATVAVLRGEIQLGKQLVPRDAVAQPFLGDQPFMYTPPGNRFLGSTGFWSLHVWAWWPSPAGIYSMWNPRINCP